MAVNEAQNEAQRIFFRREFIVVPFLIFNHQMVLINWHEKQLAGSLKAS